ncbi:MAG: ThiF family adenylyltransferase, partial [Thermoplasmata archaeon]|nr:ThiF family adenylyltransferase [Thermoplasmata archaeon]
RGHGLRPDVGLAAHGGRPVARVLPGGAGGRGAPGALYRAAGGVGTIGIAEADRVERSNLQRQILYSDAEIGQPKVERAAERLEALNPDVKVRQHPQRLVRENALEVLAEYDLVLDGTDNFPTRYLLNDACVLLGKPDVQASIYRFEGQLSVFDARKGPCYRCLFPEPPPPELVPNCAEAGVLGVLPGLVGTLQATEALKLILKVGEPLIGRLLLVDALAARSRELRLRKNPECALCGEHPTQRGLIDYPAFCGVPEEAVGNAADEIAPEELVRSLASGEPPLLIDVREPSEWAITHLEGAHLIPRAELPARLGELAEAAAVVVYCKSGRRSAAAVEQLHRLGVRRVRSLRGGLDAWAAQIDPQMPRY